MDNPDSKPLPEPAGPPDNGPHERRNITDELELVAPLYRTTGKNDEKFTYYRGLGTDDHKYYVFPVKNWREGEAEFKIMRTKKPVQQTKEQS